MLKSWTKFEFTAEVSYFSHLKHSPNASVFRLNYVIQIFNSGEAALLIFKRGSNPRSSELYMIHKTQSLQDNLAFDL